MKAPDFRYVCPETLGEALEWLARDEQEVAPLAGGQSLMPMMNFRMARPDILLDLNRVEGLSGVQLRDDRLVIGAMTRYAALVASEEVARHAPLMAKALPHIAHDAIRNRGTLGGSVALADPAAEMPAVLLASDAVIEVQSAQATRQIAAADFFFGIYDTARAPEELVTAIELPVLPADCRVGFHEIARRHGDYAMAGCCVLLGAAPGQTRISFFGVADRALRAEAAEDALAAGVDAAIAALSEIEFEGDQNANAAMKQHLAGVALARAIEDAGGLK